MKYTELGMSVHAFNPSTAEAGISMHLKSPWSMYEFQVNQTTFVSKNYPVSKERKKNKEKDELYIFHATRIAYY